MRELATELGVPASVVLSAAAELGITDLQNSITRMSVETADVLRRFFSAGGEHSADASDDGHEEITADEVHRQE